MLQVEIKTELRARSEQVALAGAASLVIMTHAQELQQQVLVKCYCVHVYVPCHCTCKYHLIKQQLLGVLSCGGDNHLGTSCLHGCSVLQSGGSISVVCCHFWLAQASASAVRGLPDKLCHLVIVTLCLFLPLVWSKLGELSQQVPECACVCMQCDMCLSEFQDRSADLDALQECQEHETQILDIKDGGL